MMLGENSTADAFHAVPVWLAYSVSIARFPSAPAHLELRSILPATCRPRLIFLILFSSSSAFSRP